MTEKLYGFKKIDSQYIKELEAEAFIYQHERLGAKLLHIPNHDNNKVFTIEFVTLPKDDTGVAHILEHSVLAGSEKFPLKEPFVNLLKSSLNTFLNAMTMSDKTIYPLASLNEKDFLNILDVYLDAVFSPNIKYDPLILKQEGWRIEQFSADEDPVFNGVVYNEMKGALASPDEKLNLLSRKLLFDNTYQYESGGDPRSIIDLTEKDFLDFYDANYHPSNCYIYLYGNMPAEPVFKALEEKFKNYEPRFDLPQNISTSKLKQPQYLESTYAGADDDLNYAQIQLVYPKNKAEETSENEYALQIAINALFNLESSIIRQNIVEKGIAQDIYAYSNSNTFDLDLSIVLVGVQSDIKPEELERIVWQELSDALKDNQKSGYLASLNSLSFALREGDSQSLPLGLIHGLNALIQWPYGISPYESLSYEEILKNLAKRIEENSISLLLEEYVIHNPHRATVLIKPDEKVANEALIIENNKLRAMYDSLNSQEKEKNIEMNLALRQKQETPDSKEALASLPVLAISDLEESKSFQVVLEDKLQASDGKIFPVITYMGKSRGISYLNYQFDLNEISQAELFDLSLFQILLGMVKTEHYSYPDLTNAILSRTGGISSSLVYNQNKKYFNIRTKVLENQIEQGIDLIEEILLRSDFLNSKDRVYQLLYMIFSRFQMSLADNGMDIAKKRLASYFNDQGMFNEVTSGIIFYQNLKQLLQTWDQVGDDFIEKLQNMSNRIFKQNYFSLFYAGENDLYEKVKTPLLHSLETFPFSEKLVPAEIWNFDLINKKEAFIIPAEIQYNLSGYNLKNLISDWKFDGRIHVLRQILNTDYLWSQVRVRGGAYGAGFSIERNGNLFCSSYRDPQCNKTFQAYKNIPAYLRNLNIDSEEWTSYIIGTFAALDQPLSFPAEARRARIWYDQNINSEQLQNERNQALNATLEDIKSFADIIEKALEPEYYCSLGSENKLKQDQALFKDLKVLE